MAEEEVGKPLWPQYFRTDLHVGHKEKRGYNKDEDAGVWVWSYRASTKTKDQTKTSDSFRSLTVEQLASINEYLESNWTIGW